MKEEKQFEFIFMQKIFKDKYEITDNLLLDSIEVYSLYESGAIDRKLAFDIIVNPECKYIVPRCKSLRYSSFLLVAQRYIDCKKITIEAKDYFHMIQIGDDYVFYMEEENDKNN